METIAIVGTGRMGSLIARKIKDKYRILLVDKDIRRCGNLAKDIHSIATGNLEVVKDADYIILALPDRVIRDILPNINSFLKGHQIVINISTSTMKKDLLDKISYRQNLISVKIIGHYEEINLGEIPLIIIEETAKDEIKTKMIEIFSNIGIVLFGNEEDVEKVNTIAGEEAIKAAINIKNRLMEQNIKQEYWSIAIRNVASGTMKAFSSGDIGPFAKRVVEELEKKNSL
jgi:pyrroline-5-carboxylate reductase